MVPNFFVHPVVVVKKCTQFSMCPEGGLLEVFLRIATISEGWVHKWTICQNLGHEMQFQTS